MRVHPATVVAAIIVLLEALTVAALALVQMLAILSGDVATVPTALALLVLTLVMGVGVFAFGIGLFRERRWARSGAIVVQILILAVALGEATGQIYGQLGVAIAIALPAAFALILLGVSGRKLRADEQAQRGTER